MEILQLANNGVHSKVMDHFQQMTPDKLVLDVPCGPGALSHALHGLGYRVEPLDIHPEHLQAPGLKALACDLNKNIPFENNYFDHAICIEGLEHTENPYNAVREITRVLKPGGTLIVTIPNYLNIERRLKFLISGSFSKPVTMQRFKDFYQNDTSGMHNSPITYPLLKFMLESCGLEITKLDKEGVKRNQKFLYPLILLIRLYTALWSRKSRTKYLLDEVNAPIIINGGNNLIVTCRKSDPGQH